MRTKGSCGKNSGLFSSSLSSSLDDSPSLDTTLFTLALNFTRGALD
jgi:hypothetical protein